MTLRVLMLIKEEGLISVLFVTIDIFQRKGLGSNYLFPTYAVTN